MKHVIPSLVMAFCAFSCESVIHAQQLPSNDLSAGTPQILPRPDSRFDGNVGRTYLESDTPQFPQPVKAPAGAPNVVLILLDDAGFGQFSTFGGAPPERLHDRVDRQEPQHAPVGK